MSLADLDTFAAVCGVPADPDQAQVWLDQATVIIQSLTGQTLFAVSDSRVILDGDGTSTLLLPEVPVTDVARVAVDGVELTPDEYEWSSDGLLRLTYPCALFPNRYQGVDVTYSHGFDPIPADLQLTCAAMACRLSRSDGGLDAGGEVTFEAVGAYQVRYATATAGLTAIESSVIDRYRVA